MSVGITVILRWNALEDFFNFCCCCGLFSIGLAHKQVSCGFEQIVALVQNAKKLLENAILEGIHSVAQPYCKNHACDLHLTLETNVTWLCPGKILSSPFHLVSSCSTFCVIAYFDWLTLIWVKCSVVIVLLLSLLLKDWLC